MCSSYVAAAAADCKSCSTPDSAFWQYIIQACPTCELSTPVIFQLTWREVSVSLCKVHYYLSPLCLRVECQIPDLFRSLLPLCISSEPQSFSSAKGVLRGPWAVLMPFLSCLLCSLVANKILWTVHKLISATTTQSHHDYSPPFTGPHCSACPNLKIKTFEAIIVTDCVTRHLVQQVPILPTACKCYQNREIISSRADDDIYILKL